jgi:hypothetical protein
MLYKPEKDNKLAIKVFRHRKEFIESLENDSQSSRWPEHHTIYRQSQKLMSASRGITFHQAMSNVNNYKTYLDLIINDLPLLIALAGYGEISKLTTLSFPDKEYLEQLLLLFAKAYPSLNLFSLGCEWAYRLSSSFKLLETCRGATIHNQLRNLSLESCVAISKCYDSTESWDEDDPISLYRAKSKGWIKHCYNANPLLKPVKWSKAKCISLAKTYNMYHEFREIENNAYEAARRNRWLEDIKVLFPTLNFNECRAIGQRYSVLSEWRKNDYPSYNIALKNNWHHQIIPPVNPKTWSLERCMASSIQYNRKGEWAKNDKAAYYAAKRYGVFEQCTAHMQ